MNFAGSEVKNFKPGDRVIVNCCTPDREAQLLQDGFDNNADGNLFMMPDDVSIEDAFKLMDAKPKDLIKPYVLI